MQLNECMYVCMNEGLKKNRELEVLPAL